MKYSFKVRIMGYIFHSACKKEYVKQGITKQAAGDIMTEHKRIVKRAKDMNDEKLLSSYIMGIYFIAMNHCTGLSAEDNYQILAAAFSGSKLLKKGLGTAESYLDKKNLPGRLQWSKESHSRKNENNWVVDVLPKCAEYDLGYDYHECGICKICRDEGCFELAKYLCRLDYIIADMMGAKLVRTQTLADGGDHCNFRYSLK